MPSDDIARLYTYLANTTVQSAQVNAEHNLFVTTLNGKFGRDVDNTLTGANTFTGNNNFSGTVSLSGTINLTGTTKADAISEYSTDAGVTVDSVVLKDGAAVFPGSAGYTPASDGAFGYDTSADEYLGQANSAEVVFLTDANVGTYTAFTRTGPEPVYLSASSVRIPAGFKVPDDTGSVLIRFTSNTDVSLASSGAGGLDTGSESSGVRTMYFLWAIRKSSDGTVSGLLSTSATSPTMPTGYDQKAHIGYAVNSATNDIIPFIQYPGEYRYLAIKGHDITSSDVYIGEISNTTGDLDASTLIPYALSRYGIILYTANSGAASTAYIQTKGDATTRITFVSDSASQRRDLETVLPCDASGVYTGSTNSASHRMQLYISGFRWGANG